MRNQCVFCNANNPLPTGVKFQGEDVLFCPYCYSTFTADSGETVCFVADGGDDLPDGWCYDHHTGEMFDPNDPRNHHRTGQQQLFE